jgi:hypothetical protein
MTACSFDPSGGAAGSERYKSMADCLMGYGSLSDGPRGGKACAAWHLCIGSHPNESTFCAHAPEASSATPSGPCKASYL